MKQSPGEKAKKLILALVEAAHEGALAGCQDGGINVDVVFSYKKGTEKEVLSVKESEKRLDKAISKMYKALTGFEVVGDPVEFINTITR